MASSGRAQIYRSVHSEQQGDKQQRHQRQAAHGRAQNAADHHAPAALGQMPEHENRHRTQGHAQPRHEAQQIGAEEFVRLKPCAQRGDEHRKSGPRSATAVWMVFTTGGAVRSRLCMAPCSFRLLCLQALGFDDPARSRPNPAPRTAAASEGTFCPAGTSAEVASWLNCRARM